MPDSCLPWLPTNRYFLVIPHFQDEKTESGVLLPEGYKPKNDRYITATVLSIAADCTVYFRELLGQERQKKQIIIDSSMLENVELNNKAYYLILENYVVGVLGKNK